MTYSTLQSKTPQLCIAIIIAILTTGFLRLQLFSGVPDSDGGFYTAVNQYIYHTLNNSGNFEGTPLFLYQFITSWVYGLDVNQYVSLRLVDGLVAVAASIVLFKVILKESGSPLFTVILATCLFIIMNDIEIIVYGFQNSIWAAYLPLFSALLVWQNASTEDKYSFYLIGGLVSLGILLREPFLPFFLLAGIAILIGYGWRVLVKYLIGSALLGFSVLGFMLMLRGWDLLDLVNSYGGFGAEFWIWDRDYMVKGMLKLAGETLQKFWFILTTTSILIIYLTKLNSTNKKLVSTNRFYFWLGVTLLPLLEWFFKMGLPYHLANCLPGLAGLSAMGWKYMSSQESERTKAISITVIGLISLFMILPTIDRTLIKSSYIYGPVDAIKWAKASDSFRGAQMIERSQYLTAAAKIYGLSRENSTLVVSGHMQGLNPLTGLLPPTYGLNDLKSLYSNLNFDQEKLISIIKKYRPTLILTTHLSSRLLDIKEKDLPGIIEKTNLYNKVEMMEENLEINYGWKAGTIYRLKDFK